MGPSLERSKIIRANDLIERVEIVYLYQPSNRLFFNSLSKNLKTKREFNVCFFFVFGARYAYN